MKDLFGLAGVAVVGAIAYWVTKDGESAFVAAAIMFLFWSAMS